MGGGEGVSNGLKEDAEVTCLVTRNGREIKNRELDGPLLLGSLPSFPK